MNEGTRVKLRKDVERYPHFVAPEGAEGIITKKEEDLIAVRLDEPLEGAEEWDNEIHWHKGQFPDSDYESAFQDDVEALEG